jgi:hypothetical protein
MCLVCKGWTLMSVACGGMMPGHSSTNRSAGLCPAAGPFLGCHMLRVPHLSAHTHGSTLADVISFMTLPVLQDVCLRYPTPNKLRPDGSNSRRQQQ